MMRANYDGVKSDYCGVPEPVSTGGKAEQVHDHIVTDVKEEGDGVRVFWKSSMGEEGSIVADRLARCSSLKFKGRTPATVH